MSETKPIEVAVIGGGCAAITAAFELTRPEHRGKYHVTIYQQGWRLGGKGASGRGPAGRIEEHGFHVWLGFYENAFRLLRECYQELNRDPRQCRIADWRDAFLPAPLVGVTERQGNGSWLEWMAHFPPGEGLPGDPLRETNPFSITSYLVRGAELLRTLLLSCQARADADAGGRREQGATAAGERTWFAWGSPQQMIERIPHLLKYGILATIAGLVEAVRVLETVLQALPQVPENLALELLDAIGSSARHQLEVLAENDDEIRRLWEIIDLLLAILRGVVRFGIVSDPRGFDSINDYECRDWLRLNGASERSLDSAILRGLYDLAFAYEDGDFQRPRLAAGQALRGSLRMFFTYRGAFFWKMRAGMGDVVFAPFYEVLLRRGVTFRFFHRLENVALAPQASLVAGERPHVQALEFDVQAEIVGGGDYRPLIDVRGLPCWPSQPDYSQLVEGDRLRRERWEFESHWERRKVGTKTLRVGEDFDFVILGVGIGAIPHVCSEIVARDARWAEMVRHGKTVATQAVQIWMREDVKDLGWRHPASAVSGFVQPFDTWADMRHLIAEESWPVPPRALAYFCCILPDSEPPVERSDRGYPERRREEVRRNAIHFLNHDIRHLWPGAATAPGQFRWQLLADAAERKAAEEAVGNDEGRFATQFWAANVNPSDRYSLCLPGSPKHRISPLDNTYDNLTIAGDWTACGFTEGCVEAAVMSGRLAAHAISQLPRLEEIIGYDHP